MAEDSSHTINAVFFKGPSATLGQDGLPVGGGLGRGFLTSAEGPASLIISVAIPRHCDPQKYTPPIPSHPASLEEGEGFWVWTDGDTHILQSTL